MYVSIFKPKILRKERKYVYEKSLIQNDCHIDGGRSADWAYSYLVCLRRESNICLSAIEILSTSPGTSIGTILLNFGRVLRFSAGVMQIQKTRRTKSAVSPRSVCKPKLDEGNYSKGGDALTGELFEGCCVEAREAYINGKETYSDYCEWVFTNTRNVAEMELADEDRDGNELGEVESLKVSFKINKENMADSGPVKTEPVGIPVNKE